ncbi:hypothetical protein EW145_g2093 [Phellinidium pouzarii]|uniref:Uncharacterized protein n=1 Tax=Phellinidium pouzarii TaxID=167371 RepID=A0A4S4LCM6_9AGAM|nr:hypothetical protein EW145_g2093 [Phellinidium pouzarii]
MPPWNAAKTKIQLRYDNRIAVQRLRLLQEKKEAQAKMARRDIATHLEQRKLEKARVKVESVISEDIHVELLELLELYCELLIARFGLLEQNLREPDPGISEGVCSIIHAAPRTELKELHVLRDILMHKFGRDFAIAVMENRDGCVMKKLEYKTPPPKLVDAYLKEIAKGYGIAWTPDPEDHDDSDSGGGHKESVLPPAIEPPLLDKSKFVADDDSPKLPDILPTEDPDKSGPEPKALGSTPAPAPPRPKSPEDEFTALAKRFEALKTRR